MAGWGGGCCLGPAFGACAPKQDAREGACTAETRRKGYMSTNARTYEKVLACLLLHPPQLTTAPPRPPPPPFSYGAMHTHRHQTKSSPRAQGGQHHARRLERSLLLTSDRVM